jgi:hypothetical protein
MIPLPFYNAYILLAQSWVGVFDDPVLYLGVLVGILMFYFPSKPLEISDPTLACDLSLEG